MLSANEVCIFNTIYNFVKDLVLLFEKDQHSLVLYNHLLSKTKLSHIEPIRKHLTCFRSFCVANREAIKDMDYTKFEQPRISYNDNVYIDICHIFSIAEPQDVPVIYEHLLVLSALLDPVSKAKEILKNIKDSTSKEHDFVSSLINKMDENTSIGSNQSFDSLLKSDFISDMISNIVPAMSNGSLDIGKLFGIMNNVVSGLSTGPNSEIGNIEDVLKMGNVGGDGGCGDIDIGSILKMMGPMLSNLSSGVPQHQSLSIDQVD